ncbi:hypothetical protein COLO4_07611 [Corchorus olitorius]|uniref:Uncharacterized protein n=1 Tax=Corchorus olitorius TaxID=93759 RepID=A0A1R3KJ64_9ROSI|nr:hypothetical protein COLO4_07611 [Corchorus olitorius]
MIMAPFKPLNRASSFRKDAKYRLQTMANTNARMGNHNARTICSNQVNDPTDLEEWLPIPKTENLLLHTPNVQVLNYFMGDSVVPLWPSSDERFLACQYLPIAEALNRNEFVDLVPLILAKAYHMDRARNSSTLRQHIVKNPKHPDLISLIDYFLNLHVTDHKFFTPYDHLEDKYADFFWVTQRNLMPHTSIYENMSITWASFFSPRDPTRTEIFNNLAISPDSTNLTLIMSVDDDSKPATPDTPPNYLMASDSDFDFDYEVDHFENHPGNNSFGGGTPSNSDL